ncbi:hypothetical protein G7K71_02820 [Desulfofundulus sp. TPOSR]|uniref:BRO family protein n=1 Tax=Desulfofundulus sp. TPOSR TaxID=2714340 RepID=UPI00140DD880|nr:BRO family protein [Desulfofundulus sp. TPOSR]NHM25959.1 hypothetical protein [Desulfofundulus sp. TPOSR]
MKGPRKQSEYRLVKSEPFGTVVCNFYESRNGEVWLTRRQIGEALEYKYPENAIKNIHMRYRERLDKFLRVAQIELPSGGIQKVVLYTWKDVYEICRWSNKPKANKFIDWVWDVPEAIRQGRITYEVQRAVGKITRRTLTDSIKESGLNEEMHGWGYKAVTDLVYKAVLGMTARQYRETRGLPVDANVRDYLDSFQLSRVEKAEKLAHALVDAGAGYEQVKKYLFDFFRYPVLVEKSGR